jgi:hypothetical protein
MQPADERLIESLPTCVVFRSRSGFERRLCNLLADASMAVMAMSFAQPLRDAIRGLYFNGDPAVDFDAPDFRLPLGQDLATNEHALRKTLVEIGGPEVFGALASLQIEEGRPMWSTFAFEDGWNEDDLSVLRKKYAANVLEVWVGKVNDLVKLPPITEHLDHLYVPILSNEIDNEPLLDRFLLCLREWRERNGKAPI